MNRNKIKTAAGATWLTVPVFKKGHREKKTSEIQINNELDWKKKHLKTIQNSYGKTDYFEKYFSFFEDLYSKNWVKLADLNEFMLKWFLKELGIKTKFLKASDYDFKGTKSDLVLDMCKKLETDLYIFGALGKEYANVIDFENECIEVIFQNYNHPVYPQKFEFFLPNLSILDLIFNCGPKSLDIIMSGNITKNTLKKFAEK